MERPTFTALLEHKNSGKVLLKAGSIETNFSARKIGQKRSHLLCKLLLSRKDLKRSSGLSILCLLSVKDKLSLLMTTIVDM